MSAHKQIIPKPLFSAILASATLGVTFLLTAYSDPPTLLDQVIQKGELVVASRNSPTTYYEGAQGPTGFEYDLARLFAEHLGVRLRIVTPPRFNDILPLVTRREVHFAAAGLTVTAERQRRVRFGPAYQEITQQLIYRSGSPAPVTPADLRGDVIEVVAGSSHAERLRQLAAEYPGIRWAENHHADIEELLSRVWKREIRYTVADSNEIRFNQHLYPELRVAFDLTRPQRLAWAFPRGSDDSLLRAARVFFSKIRTNGQLDQLRERYYGHIRDFDYVGTRKFLRHIERRLPRYRSTFRAAAIRHHLDWRLLAAVGYQESHWNPKAISPTGVRGIMMLTRTTAADLGITNRIDPDNSIRGGARYLQQIRGRIPRHIAEPDRTWFALAAYNLGLGHVEDARLLTEQRGGDPDKWMDVKKTLPLLMQKRWYQRTRHGYARGLEAVKYVENIRSYYDILVWRSEPRTAPRIEPPRATTLTRRPLGLTVRLAASPVL